MKLLKNVKISGAERQEPVDILLAGGKIAEIGERLDYSLACLEVVDCQGATAIPGYLDQHVHVTGGGGEGGYRNRVPELMFSECVKGGITTLVGLLGTDATTRSVENLVAKTKELRDGGITAYCLTGAYEYPSPTLTGSVKRDIVFIEEIIGVKIAISDHRGSNLSKEDLVRVAAEARLGGVVSGKPGITTLHVGAGKGGISMIVDIVETHDIPIKAFRPTHLERIPDEAVAFANMGGYIDFTTGIDTSQTARVVAKALTQAPAENVTISTDSNGSMPKWDENRRLVGMGVGKITTMHETVQKMVREQGMVLHDAVKVGTAHVAKALELYPRKGTIEVGADADLLLLDDNLDILSTIAGGTFLMRDRVVLAKGVFEQ